MWRIGDCNALLVGRQNGAAAMENSIKLSQNIKNRATVWQKSHF